MSSTFTYLRCLDPKRPSLMKFRLTYEGEIPSGQSSPGQAKVEMRKSFHNQLERLWERTNFLKNATTTSASKPESQVQVRALSGGSLYSGLGTLGDKSLPYNEAIGNLYRQNGYRFVPIAREDAGLRCGLDILFLRSDGFHSPVTAGDLDNRVKTIIDALKRPKNANELKDYSGEDDSLFYVLLDDDDLLDALTVETGELLSPNPSGDHRNPRWSKIVVNVTITPYAVDGFNIAYL